MRASEDYYCETQIAIGHFAQSRVVGFHFIPKINWGSLRGRSEEKWGSFQGRYHFQVELGIISGSGSFWGLDSTFYHNT